MAIESTFHIQIALLNARLPSLGSAFHICPACSVSYCLFRQMLFMLEKNSIPPILAQCPRHNLLVILGKVNVCETKGFRKSFQSKFPQ